MKNNDNIDDFLSKFMLTKRKCAKPCVELETDEENESIDDFLSKFMPSKRKGTKTSAIRKRSK